MTDIIDEGYNHEKSAHVIPCDLALQHSTGCDSLMMVSL